MNTAYGWNRWCSSHGIFHSCYDTEHHKVRIMLHCIRWYFLNMLLGLAFYIGFIKINELQFFMALTVSPPLLIIKHDWHFLHKIFHLLPMTSFGTRDHTAMTRRWVRLAVTPKQLSLPITSRCQLSIKHSVTQLNRNDLQKKYLSKHEM